MGCFTSYFSENTHNILVPPHVPIDFYDKGLQRLNKIMFAGNIHEGKGILEIIDYAKNNPQIIFDFYFQRGSPHLLTQLKKLPNCNLVGYVEKEKIFENYNKYEYFIHIPSHKEAFGRAVAEALLCGCKLISNSKIGVLSYNWSYDELRKNTLLGNYLFWYKLSDILKI
jgi:glycosyltransferase involved in cell wall biosynthesis